MCKLLALALTLCSVLVGTTDCTSSFDQRQTGDLNVQIGLKNINIIALLKGGKEEYVDYDYAYDYSEMTIKPQNGTTTPKPLNANTTISTTVLLEQTTEGIRNSTGVAVEVTEASLNQPANNNVVTTPQATADILTTIAPDSSNKANITTALPIPNKCRRGFVQNNEGKCEYKVHGTSNALRRIVKLAQKIKIGRQYEESQD
ncbi:unnamed protein product [Spodoptera exigua]|nr:unnamed protein product [Spodoptera exigua]